MLVSTQGSLANAEYRNENQFQTKNYEFACKIVDILVTFTRMALFENYGVVKQVVSLLWSSPENF